MQISVIWLCGIMYLLAFVITLILVPFSIKLAHKTGAIDIPKDERRVHKKPIPRIGGVAIFAGTGELLWFSNNDDGSRERG